MLLRVSGWLIAHKAMTKSCKISLYAESLTTKVFHHMNLFLQQVTKPPFSWTESRGGYLP